MGIMHLQAPGRYRGTALRTPDTLEEGYKAARLLKYKSVDDMALSPTLRLQSLSILEDSAKVCYFDLPFAWDLVTY